MLVSKDVAEILGYKDTDYTIRTHVDDEDKGSNEMWYPWWKSRNDSDKWKWSIFPSS